jgi:hypothetical protein
VRSGGQESSVGAVTCGVSQGSVLGPLLFIYHILKTSRRLSGIAVFTFMRMIYRFITPLLWRTFKKRCIDELSCEWSSALSNEESVNSRCRVDNTPTTLLIGSDIINVVPEVNNIGFVLNEILTVTDHFKKVCQKVYWILCSLRPRASHTPFELGESWLCHLLWLTLDMGYCVCWCGCCTATQVEYGF